MRPREPRASTIPIAIHPFAHYPHFHLTVKEQHHSFDPEVGTIRSIIVTSNLQPSEPLTGQWINMYHRDLRGSLRPMCLKLEENPTYSALEDKLTQPTLPPIGTHPFHDLFSPIASITTAYPGRTSHAKESIAPSKLILGIE